MPRLIAPALGNGRRPSDPDHSAGAPNDTVPILDVSEETHELVGSVHDATLDPEDETQPLTRAVVILDNPHPVGAPGPSRTLFSIGASTLHEAVTEVIGVYPLDGLDMPQWVASDDENLARVIAEHFTVPGYSTCEVIPLEEAS